MEPSFGRWLELPEHLLVSIAHRISFSIPDLLPFASVCPHFRSAVAVAVSSPDVPPLLLSPVVDYPHRLHRATWVQPPRCDIQTLVPNRSKPYRSPISSGTLAQICIGYSHSHLIFIVGSFALLANVFTGREIRSPSFPPGPFDFSFGILTGPPTSSSSSCSVLLVAQCNTGNSILRWSPTVNDEEWSELDVENSAGIVSLVVCRGQIFALDRLCRVIVVEFVPDRTWTLLTPQSWIEQFVHNHPGIFCHHFLECNSELLAVFPTCGSGGVWEPDKTKFVVYKLDLEKSIWLEKEDLGDWCLFIDPVGIGGFSCRDPARWGGRKNCIYIAGPGYDGWKVFPLDGAAIETTAVDTPLRSRYLKFYKWPSPVWVYPSLHLDSGRRPSLALLTSSVSGPGSSSDIISDSGRRPSLALLTSSVSGPGSSSGIIRTSRGDRLRRSRSIVGDLPSVAGFGEGDGFEDDVGDQDYDPSEEEEYVDSADGA